MNSRLSCGLRLLLLTAAGLLAGLRPAPAQTPAPAPAPPPDTAALGATYRNPARPDTVRLAAGLALLQTYGSDVALLPRREALAQRLLAEARRLRHPRLETDALEELLLLTGQTNRPAEQLRYTRQLLALARQQQDTVALVSANHKLANCYFDAQNMAEARRYAEQADALMRRHPVSATAEATLLASLTNIYLELHQPALARRTFRRALPATRRTGNPLYEFNLLTTYANGLRLAQPDSALRYLRPALALAQRLADPYALAYVHLVLLQTYKPLARWPQVRAEARATLHYARLSATPDYEAEALAGLAESLRHLGQGAAAYDTLRLAQTLLDTLQAASTRQELAALQVQAGTERQQAQIRALEQGRRLAAQRQELTQLRTRQERVGLGALGGLLLLGAGGLFTRYRRRQAAARTLAETSQRRRIAAELHDDVGSLLTQVSMESELLRLGLTPAHEQPAQLRRMASSSRDAVRQMADVVWGLGQLDHAATLGPLLDRMRDHADLMLPPAGLDFGFETAAALATLPAPAAVQQTLYLIYKEALHNAVKYAQGTTAITATLRHEGRSLVLRVADNGRALAALPAARPGHGLANMAARAAAVGGHVGYDTAGGFAVQAQVPLG